MIQIIIKLLIKHLMGLFTLKNGDDSKSGTIKTKISCSQINSEKDSKKYKSYSHTIISKA